jgi:hypothetical protein
VKEMKIKELSPLSILLIITFISVGCDESIEIQKSDISLESSILNELHEYGFDNFSMGSIHRKPGDWESIRDEGGIQFLTTGLLLDELKEELLKYDGWDRVIGSEKTLTVGELDKKIVIQISINLEYQTTHIIILDKRNHNKSG